MKGGREFEGVGHSVGRGGVRHSEEKGGVGHSEGREVLGHLNIQYLDLP